MSNEATFTRLCRSITYQAALIEQRWRSNCERKEAVAHVAELRRLLNRAETLIAEPQESEVAALVDIGYTRSAALYELRTARHDGSDVNAARRII